MVVPYDDVLLDDSRLINRRKSTDEQILDQLHDITGSMSEQTHIDKSVDLPANQTGNRTPNQVHELYNKRLSNSSCKGDGGCEINEISARNKEIRLSSDGRRHSTNSKRSSHRESNCSIGSVTTVDSSNTNVSKYSTSDSSGKSPPKPKPFTIMRAKLLKGGITDVALQGKLSSPDQENVDSISSPTIEQRDILSKPKKNSTSSGGKRGESKARMFLRKRRYRHKLISNAGNSLWQSVVCNYLRIEAFSILMYTLLYYLYFHLAWVSATYIMKIQ